MKNTISILILITIVILSIGKYANVDLTNKTVDTLSQVAKETQDTATKLATVALNQNEQTEASDKKAIELEKNSEITLQGNQIIPIVSVKIHENPNDKEQSIPSETNKIAENTKIDTSARASLDSSMVKAAEKTVVNFDFASANLNLATKKSISKISNQLKQAKTIQLQGFTDNVGNEKANLKISSSRIIAVKNEMIKLGIEPEKIKEMPLGASQPIASNDSEDGRKANRRVEIVIN